MVINSMSITHTTARRSSVRACVRLCLRVCICKLIALVLARHNTQTQTRTHENPIPVFRGPSVESVVVFLLSDDH